MSDTPSSFSSYHNGTNLAYLEKWINTQLFWYLNKNFSALVLLDIPREVFLDIQVSCIILLRKAGRSKPSDFKNCFGFPRYIDNFTFLK